MEGGEEEVAGEGGFDGYFCRFLIAYFADEDDVGVHTEVTAEGGGESESDFFVHLHLIDAWDCIFDGVFGGLDVDIGGGDFAQG